MADEEKHQATFAYPWRWLLGLEGVFILVHLAYYGAGIRFDRSTLVEVMHFLDPALLQTRLLESVFYLHIQPPLMNLVTGLILKITPESAWLFQALFLGFGLLFYLSIFLIQLRLGVHKLLAALLSTVFMASPAFILWEHILIYTFPCASLLAFATLLLFDVLQTGNRKAVHAFFWTLFLIAGMRSMFHLGYLILVWLGLTGLCKEHRKRLALAGLAPVLLLASFSVKNGVLFGEYNTCSFVEKNLWIMTVGNMPWDERVKLVEEGKLSDLALTNRWASLDAFPPKYKDVPERFADIPALATTHKSTRKGVVNYNHYGNIAICNVYGDDAKYVLRHYPYVYLVNATTAFYRYFKSNSALPVSPQNQKKISGLLKFYDTVIYGKLPFAWFKSIRLVEMGGNPPYLFILLGMPFLFFYGLWRGWFRPESATQRWVLLFMCFNILMVAGLGCALDFHETARYRFLTDGLSVAILGLVLTDGWQWCRARRE